MFQMTKLNFFIFILINFQVSITFALIGYDCGARTLNITTLSLLEVGDCELPDVNINTTQKYIQLLQISDYSELMVRQCKVEIRRTIFHCGM